MRIHHRFAAKIPFALLIGCLIGASPVSAKLSFWDSMMLNIKKSLTPSEFICDKYEEWAYETRVLRPGMKLPFTELKSNTRYCIEWQEAPDAAIGKSCKKYAYENSSGTENEQFYQKVTRYRTVCVEGHNSR